MSGTAEKVITCKAAVVWEAGKPLSIETIQVAPPKAGEVRIRIVASGVCKTDAFFKDSIHPACKFPVILGHEGAGIVESIGEGVTSLQPGDHVIPLYIPRCGKCSVCIRNKSNLCKKVLLLPGPLSDGTSRFTCKGKNINHFFKCSTFTEYTVVEEVFVCKVRKDAALNKVCLLGCAVPTGYGAAINTAGVDAGSTCAIWGLGAVGLSIIMGCKAAGASKIIGIDLNPDKFIIGKKLGLTDFKDYPDKLMKDLLIELTNGGVDYAFECIGKSQATMTAIASTAVSSVTVVLGTDVEPITVHPSQLLGARTLKGSIFGDYKGREDLPKLIDGYMQGNINLDDFVSHTLKLEEINDAFNLMKEGKVIRVVIELGDDFLGARLLRLAARL